MLRALAARPPFRSQFMLHVVRLLLFAGALVVLTAGERAEAHPHVMVTMKSEVVYAPDGSATGVRHIWTFDEMFSSFATQGLDKNNDGVLSRDELQELAEVNVTSLKEFGYFSSARANGKKSAFGDPTDYWLEHADGLLTLHFTLPFKTPVKAQTLDLDVYDPTYFVAFTLADKDPVTLVSAPPQCTAQAARPGEAGAQAKPLSESFFNQLDAGSNYGAQFANRISVKCP